MEQQYTPPLVGKPKKPFYKKWWFIALAAIIVIGVIANLSGRDKADTTAPATESSTTAAAKGAEPTKQDAPATAGVGTPVSSGDLQLTVKTVHPPVALVGSDALGAKAQGEYLLLDIEVTNNGDKAQSFYSGQLKIKSAGKEFRAGLDGGDLPPRQLGNVVQGDQPPATPLRHRGVRPAEGNRAGDARRIQGDLFSKAAVVSLS